MKNTHKLTILEKSGYGLGDTASNLYFQMFMNFLLFFYTDVFGIPAEAAGTMFLVTRIWDTLNDPIMGIIADRTNTRWGKFRPYLLWGIMPMFVIGIMMFTTPDFDDTGKLVYAYITYSLMMMAYTFINIPYSALMGVMTPDSLERTSISSYRFVLAFAGGFLIQGLTLPMVEYFGEGDQALGFQMVMVVYGVLAGLLFYFTFATTRERVQPPSDQSNDLRNDLKDLAKNGPWIATFFMGIFTLTYIVIRMGSIMYYFKYNIGDEALASLFMVLGTVGVIAGVAVTKRLAARVGKTKLYLYVMILTVILTALFYFVPEENIYLVFGLHILISTVMAPQAPLVWAMYADTADYSEWQNGRRATALIFSAATFAQKLGVAVGGGLAGWFLAMFGFVANVEQTPEALEGIRLMMSVIPAITGIGSIVAVFFYKLDDNKMAEIEADLEKRRAQSES
jgi:GPH family glycoside/pentoside/hexuronide:cation symporter